MIQRIFCHFRKEFRFPITCYYIKHNLSETRWQKFATFKAFPKRNSGQENNFSNRSWIKLNSCKFHSHKDVQNIKNRNTLYYLSAMTVLVGGFTYLSVLLYRLYCQSTGKGGRPVLEEAGEKISKMKKITDRFITVSFNADVNSTLAWNFKPQQPSIEVSPGETALAFYTALNPTNRPVIGVATYNVLPFEAGKYFNKIQCFCFEEQQLNPNEEVDMPVFFYLDPEYAEDPRLENINHIILSYTFFEAKEGMQLPRPAFV